MKAHVCMPLDGAANGTLESLLEKIAQHDSAAFADLERLMRKRIQYFVNRLVRDTCDAEEITQDVFRYVWVNAAKFLSTRGSALSWILMIARCRSLDQLRRCRTRPATTDVEDVVIVAPDANPELAQQRASEEAALSRIVAALPAHQRELVRLTFYEDCSHTDLAKLTGLPLGTVKTRLRCALKTMRNSLSGQPPFRCRAISE